MRILEFVWSDLRHIDPKDQAAILDTYVKDGIYAQNEARAILGLAPVAGGASAIFLTAQGPVLDVQRPARKAAPEPTTETSNRPCRGIPPCLRREPKTTSDLVVQHDAATCLRPHGVLPGFAANSNTAQSVKEKSRSPR